MCQASTILMLPYDVGWHIGAQVQVFDQDQKSEDTDDDPTTQGQWIQRGGRAVGCAD